MEKRLSHLLLSFVPGQLWLRSQKKNNEVVRGRQYRHGVQEILLELPGGVVDEGENPLDGARREWMEETGYSAEKIIQTGRGYPHPAIQEKSLFCYLAIHGKPTGGQHFDDPEEIEVQVAPLDELVEMARQGKFLHALNVAALFLALAHLKKI